MRIDCNNIPLGLSTNINDLNKLKSGKLVRSLLEINEKMLGLENSSTAETFNNLAYSYARLGRHEQALILDQILVHFGPRAHSTNA